MAGEKYADKAVAKLLSYFEANLGTYLDAIETAQSLTAGTMVHPVDYVGAFLPEDTRSPLFCAWCKSGTPHNQDISSRVKLYTYECSVSIGFAGDANAEAGQLMSRRYLTALIDCLHSGPTLSGTVIEAFDTSNNLFGTIPGDANTRHGVEMSISIIVHET